MCYRETAALSGERAPVFGPQRLEVHSQTDGAAPIHLCCLPIQRGDLDLRCCCWVCCRDVKLKVKLILYKLVHILALARPVSSVLVGGNSEPV